MTHEINSILCVGVGGGRGAKGTGEVIHLFYFKLCVWGGVGEEGGDREGDSLTSNCIEKSNQ